MKSNYQDLHQFIEDELISLWSNLRTAHEQTIGNDGMARMDGKWSMACDDIGERIKRATELVGPVKPGNIGMTSIADGWFAWANRKVGIDDPDLPSQEMIDYSVNWMNQQRGVVTRMFAR